LVLAPEVALRAVVVIVTHNWRGMIRKILEDWVDVVVQKLRDGGVVTLREFVEGGLVLNWRLERVGHCQLHEPTLQAMLEEAVDMVFWSGAGEEVEEPEVEVESEVGVAKEVTE
jgi:ribosomal protein L30/L7E